MASKPTRHSYSSLKMFKECPAKYGYSYVQRLPMESTAAMDRGTRLHKLAEDYMADRSQETACHFDLRKIGLKLYTLRQKSAIPEQTWLLDASWQPTDNPDAAKIKAIVDVHYMGADGVLKIHDYKSGRAYPEHDDQLEFYALIGLRQYPTARRVEASAIYIDSGVEGPSRSVLHEMFGYYARRWVELVGRVDSEVRFAATPGGCCKRCAYRSDTGGPCDEWRKAA